MPAGASRGLAVATTAGCTQCHHPLFNNGRGVMGAINASFEWFKAIVYAHPAAYPATRARLGEPPYERLAMGSFSASRLPDSMLQDVWTYSVDLGFRARLHGQLSAGVPSTDGVVYRLDVENTGPAGTGLAAGGSDRVLGETLEVGLALSSHVDGVRPTATLDNVSIRPLRVSAL